MDKSKSGRGGYKSSADKPAKRDPILDLSRFNNQEIRVGFVGHRQVTGILKGWDQLLNLVMDDVKEELLDPELHESFNPKQYRNLGLVVLRGPNVSVISPMDGAELVENPFLQQEEEQAVI